MRYPTPLTLACLVMGSLSLSAPTLAVETCTAEDQTGGFGGQKLGCTFDCPGPAGTFTGSIDADDDDAQVSLTVSCGEASAHCSGDDACNTGGSYSSASAGHCKGDSDETIDSGLYIGCGANSGATPVTPECILHEPVEICPEGAYCGFDNPQAPGGSMNVNGLVSGVQDFDAPACMIEVCIELSELVRDMSEHVADWTERSCISPEASPSDAQSALVAAVCGRLVCTIGTTGLTIWGPPGSVHAFVDGNRSLGLRCATDSRCTGFDIAHAVDPLSGRHSWTLA